MLNVTAIHIGPCLLFALSMCHADGPSVSPRWTPIGRGDPLYFGPGDAPETEIPHVVLFADPTLEDPTHMSTFYFESAEAWRQAAVALDLDPPPCSAH